MLETRFPQEGGLRMDRWVGGWGCSVYTRISQDWLYADIPSIPVGVFSLTLGSVEVLAGSVDVWVWRRERKVAWGSEKVEGKGSPCTEISLVKQSR